PADSDLARRLADTPPADHERILLDLVLTEVAAALGHDSPDALEAARPFKALGFDSLIAVNLRNRLRTSDGLPLPATLVFDHPTNTAIARHLQDEILGLRAAAPPPAGVAVGTN
ncbi:hypothetical protein VM98_36205, partial [Streptomyces rubellomurinus subsp. indigoferus]